MMVMKFRRFNRIELILFSIMLLGASFLRFTQLGYSHYYGDETKALYWRKFIPFEEFFLNQRKGPFQFLLTWFIEKTTGSYDELLMRIPFALAGIFSVVIFYILVRKLFNARTALVASTLFSLSGFHIAFSRTVQYQSFVVLFGLLAIYLYIYSLESGRRKFTVMSSISMAVSFYFHYDAVFFLLPIMYLFYHFRSEGMTALKQFLQYFVAPLGLILSVFYVPYFFGGYFTDNTYLYLSRRFAGTNLLPNNSLYTYKIYNPCYLFYIPLLSVFPFLLARLNFRKELLLLWFFLPFFLFQLVVMNPGTHIHNYFIPLFIMTGFLFDRLLNIIKRDIWKYVAVASAVLVFLYMFIVQTSTYVPYFNKGYPWIDSTVAFTKQTQANRNYQLFLYGFPYNRGWDQVREFMLSQGKIESVYSDENDTIAEFYLRGFTYAPPTIIQKAEYFFEIIHDQETSLNETYLEKRRGSYTLIKEIYVEDAVTARIYKRNRL
jgi:4-amino-4-deoxy-L-arabinose transferase-like glycosyltransferase